MALKAQDGHIFSYYNKRKIRRTLTVRQFSELQDSRVVLGITLLFYATNALLLYIRLNNVSYLIHSLAKYSRYLPTPQLIS